VAVVAAGCARPQHAESPSPPPSLPVANAANDEAMRARREAAAMDEPVSVVLESVAALHDPDRVSFTFALTNNTRVQVGVSKLDLTILGSVLQIERPEGPVWLLETKPTKGPRGCILAPPDSIDKAGIGPRKRIDLTLEEPGRLSEAARAVISSDKRPTLFGDAYGSMIINGGSFTRKIVLRGPVEFGTEN
jgi:hypothetical protein